MGPKSYDQVCYALYSTSNQITQAYRSLLQPLKLTYPQFVVMMALWEKDDVSVTSLAEVVGLSKPTMTPLLKRLELLGYVSRNSVRGDDRQKRITLTPLGQSLAKEASAAAKAALCATGLDDDEVAELIQLCVKIKTSLPS